MSVDWTNPILEDVKRIVILVDIKPTLFETQEGQLRLPEQLRTKSIEETLRKVYTERFSTHGGKLFPTSTPGCHGRADQRVTVIPYIDSASIQRFNRAANDAGTLAVTFQGTVLESSDQLPWGSSLMVVSVLNMRNDLEVSAKGQLLRSWAISFEWDHEKKNYVEYYAKGGLY